MQGRGLRPDGPKAAAFTPDFIAVTVKVLKSRCQRGLEPLTVDDIFREPSLPVFD